MENLRLFKIGFFCGQDRLVFCRERQKSLFLGKICLKRNFKLFIKTMEQPLLKNANFATFLNRSFYGQKRLVFYIERLQTLFLGEMYLKGKKKEISNF